MADVSFDSPSFTAARASDSDQLSRAGLVDSLAGLVDVVVEPTVAAALRAVQEILGMEVAYVSQIVGGDMVLTELEGDGESFRMKKGLTLPLEQTYCQRMLDGRIPNLVPDVRSEDRLAGLAITRAADIGAFATVPLTFADGRVRGTLCAASHGPKSLDHRELQFLKVVARLVADQLERDDVAVAVRELAGLVDAADDAIMGVALSGTVRSWNLACERVFGYSANEAIGRSVIELIAPAGKEEGMRKMLTAAASGQIVHHESARRRADGVIIDAAVTLSPVRDKQGDVSFLSAVIRDVSVRAREARYRAVEREVIGALASANDASEAAVKTLRAIGGALGCDFGLVWEVDEQAKDLGCTAMWVSEHSVARSFATDLREGAFAHGQGLPERTRATGAPAWIENIADDLDSARATAATAAGLRSVVALPLRSAGETVGVVEFFSCQPAPRSATVLAIGEAVVARLADALQRHHAQEAVRAAARGLEIRVRERTSELQHALHEVDAAQVETVQRLSRAVEFRDEDTGAHIARISKLASAIAHRAGLDTERCTLIERASPLHDVGKVAIPDSVLLKPGPLTPDERSIIETHAEIGHQLLDGSNSAVLKLAASIALTHHEHYDGNGYPNGLAGHSIPIEGRIVALADVYDALTSDRVYRPAMSADQALAILTEGRATHFDPALLDHFLEVLKEPELGGDGHIGH